MAKKTKAKIAADEKEGTIDASKEVGSLVRKLESTYITGSTMISKYVNESMYENINKIDAYLKSRHISGDTDSMGREKPFFNIVTAAVNIWYRATDIDRKNIKIKAKKIKQILVAFLASVKLQDWMRRENFGRFLNDWGLALARYGSAVLKFVEKEGRLIPMVVAWNRLIVDDVDFDGNVKIEVLELTEAQLYERADPKKGYDPKMVEALCNAARPRTLIGGQQQDTKPGYIKLYEIHGMLPLSYITELEADEDIYVQQMHVISYVASAKNDDKYQDFTLVKGREDKDPYMITHLIKEDGQTLSIGAVQHLFEAQWMMNHTVKSIKDELDLASKLIFQTSDGNFVGQNALNAIESGDILIHRINEPLTQLNNQSHDITQIQNFAAQWKNLANEVTGVSEAMLGAQPKSGTAWRQTEALLQESYSLFELMTENKGLHIEEMMRRFVIPHIKTQLDTTEEVSATLDSFNVTQIDSMYIKNIATRNTNRMIIDAVLAGDRPSPEDQAKYFADQSAKIKDTLASLGNQRFFKPSEIDDKTWADLFDDFEWEAEVDVTGEDSNDKEDLTTLTTVFQTIADPIKRQVLQTPQGKFLFNKILSRTSAVSPIEMPNADITPPANAVPTAPAVASATPQNPQSVV